jgi:hypothetical protein
VYWCRSYWVKVLLVMVMARVVLDFAPFTTVIITPLSFAFKSLDILILARQVHLLMLLIPRLLMVLLIWAGSSFSLTQEKYDHLWLPFIIGSFTSLMLKMSFCMVNYKKKCICNFLQKLHHLNLIKFVNWLDLFMD